MRADSLNGLRAVTGCEVEWMNLFSIRRPQIHRSTLQETINLAQASPRIALLWIGAAALLATAFLMWLFVALLR